MSNFSAFDDYDEYEDLYDPMQIDRQARRKRKPRKAYQPKKSRDEIIDEIVDVEDLETTTNMSYTPSLYEAEWLESSLQPFFIEKKISDVLALIKGGKEANVYRCEADNSTGMDYMAAKVYRPRMFRNLRNDKTYREGREILSAEGQAITVKEKRTMRALQKKSNYGNQVAHTSWLMYEFTTLQDLYEAGADVPEPYAVANNAILMGYIGDGQLAASTLNHIRLERDEAHHLFDDVLRNIDIMLAHDLVHGDLSAYNILYWQGDITLIDFPQVVDIHSNSNAYTILQRDITRICEYFSKQGVDCNAQETTQRLWNRYVERDEIGIVADMSRYETEEDED